MNTKLLKKVQAAIKAEPKRLNMWMPLTTSGLYDPPACGTVGCIAGWSLVLDSKIKRSTQDIARVIIRKGDRLDPISNWDKIARNAQSVLGLDTEQANRLFILHEWPWALLTQYTDAEGQGDQKKMAGVTCKRINLFIKTRGEE